jgi:hypothetical protein
VPKHILRAAAWPRRREDAGLRGKEGGDAGAHEGRQEEAPPESRGAGTDRCGDEEAMGGGEEGQGGGEISRLGPEARCSGKRRQEFNAGGRTAEGAWPGEGDAEATRPRGERRAGPPRCWRWRRRPR